MAETTSGLMMIRQAALALNGFPTEDQANIRSTLGHLIGPSAIEELGSRVHRLESDEPIYSVSVPSDILVLFTRRGDTILILDVVRRGALKAFAFGSTRAHVVGVGRPKGLEKPLPSDSASPIQRNKVRRVSRRGPR